MVSRNRNARPADRPKSRRDSFIAVHADTKKAMENIAFSASIGPGGAALPSFTGGCIDAKRGSGRCGSRGVRGAAATLAARRTAAAVLRRSMFAIASAGNVPTAGGNLKHDDNGQQSKNSTHGFHPFFEILSGSIRLVPRGGPRGLSAPWVDRQNGRVGRSGRIPFDMYFFVRAAPLS